MQFASNPHAALHEVPEVRTSEGVSPGTGNARFAPGTLRREVSAKNLEENADGSGNTRARIYIYIYIDTMNMRIYMIIYI